MARRTPFLVLGFCLLPLAVSMVGASLEPEIPAFLINLPHIPFGTHESAASK